MLQTRLHFVRVSSYYIGVFPQELGLAGKELGLGT